MTGGRDMHAAVAPCSCSADLLSALHLTLSDDVFGSAEALVACRQLGFADGTVVDQYNTTYRISPGTGPILLDNVACDPAVDARIEDCSSNGWGVHNCVHGEDVGVYCSRFPIALPPSSPSGDGGAVELSSIAHVICNPERTTA